MKLTKKKRSELGTKWTLDFRRSHRAAGNDSIRQFELAQSLLGSLGMATCARFDREPYRMDLYGPELNPSMVGSSRDHRSIGGLHAL